MEINDFLNLRGMLLKLTW